MADVIMPKMGDAMEAGRIVQWLKKVGDTVAVGDPLLEIETDKSNVEIEAEDAGTLQSIAVEAGSDAPVGSVIATIGAGAPAAAPPKRAEPEAAQPEPDAAKPPRSNGSEPSSAPPAKETAVPVSQPAEAQAAPAAPASRPQTAPSTSPGEPFKPYDSFVGLLPENLGGTASLVGEPLTDGEGGAVPAGADGRVKATPVARAMAQQNGIDLSALRGTGPDGTVVKADVEAALSARASAQPTTATQAQVAPAPPVQTGEGDEVQEYNAMRRTIARRLAESKSTIPHFYVTSEIDVEAMLALRQEVNASAETSQKSSTEEGGPKISLNDFLVKAAAVALAAHPVINSVFSDNKRIIRRAVHIGIAVSIEDGLIVPVVRDVHVKSLRALSAETHPLIEKARTGKLKPEEYTGGTFTITNLGQFDVENFAAIINPGEGAILAVSSIRDVAAVVNGQVVPRKRMKVTLCADHRVMDGVAAAQFLQELKRVIENPLNILL